MSDVELTSVRVLAEESDRMGEKDYLESGEWDDCELSAWDQDHRRQLTSADCSETDSPTLGDSTLHSEAQTRAVRSISIRHRRHVQPSSHSATVLKQDSHKQLMGTGRGDDCQDSAKRRNQLPRLFKSNALCATPDLLSATKANGFLNRASLLQFRRRSHLSEDGMRE